MERQEHKQCKKFFYWLFQDNIFIYFMQLWDKCGTSSSGALGNLHLWVHRFSLRDLCNHIAGSATKSSLPKCCGDIIPGITAAL